MRARHHDELVCDFAEYYNVLDFETLPARLAATLAVGLPERSRTIRAVSGTKLSIDTTLLTLIFDVVNWLKWAQTKDASKGRNRPKSIYEALTQPKEDKIMTFASGEEFERQRAMILGESDGN